VSEAPDTLVAELTYRCPLRCAYCSNPLSAPMEVLSTRAWQRVFAEAAALGVLQLHLTGGEPLLRPDLASLIAEARSHALYVNLITSGVPLDEDRLRTLAAAGLHHVQLSLQAADAAHCDRIAGAPVFDQKLRVARHVVELGLPLTLNVVLHRENIGDVRPLIALAESLGAHRLELAHAQYLGWALVNRSALLPTAAQVAEVRRVVAGERARLRGRMDLVHVLPDYFAGRPRACMDGWARRYLVLTPDGRVMPCQGAHAIPDLVWERVGERPLADIWRDSPALVRFRGNAWLPEPCRSCDERDRDFGGCRCQAFALTGDAAATDPVCNRAPRHALVMDARQAEPTSPQYRRLHLATE
jgi:pyrroloquinoline quinone biosynthesis protein E